MSAFASASETAPRRIWDGVAGRVVMGGNATLGVIELAPGSVVPEHSHPNEQLGILLEGTVTFRIGGERRTLQQRGDTWSIPPDVPHEAQAGEAGAVVAEAFAPARADWHELPLADPPGDRLARDRRAGFGARTWYFPDGDLPPAADGPWEPHEALMILNVADRPAHILIDLFWTDRAPTLGLSTTVEPERVVSLRAPYGQGAEIPERTQYALRVRSDVPVICQYGRLEMVPSFALYTTMGLADST
jgi:quercetin dioxygenase-like cupin family protein